MRFIMILALLFNLISAKVFNLNSNSSYDSIQEAIKNAKNGDILEIEGGNYKGGFVIDKKVTLIGKETKNPPILDGQNLNSVIEILANGVKLKNLKIINSKRRGINGNDAAILVKSNSVKMEKLDIAKGGNGIILLKSKNCTVSYCKIHNNSKTGIKIIAGKNNKIEFNEINRNLAGVVLTKYFKNGIVKPERLSKDNISENNTVANNKLIGNSNMGIELNWYAGSNIIAKNEIFNTGREIAPKIKSPSLPADLLKKLKSSGVKIPSENNVQIEPGRIGSGIFVSCFSNRNEITENVIKNSLGDGIDLFESDHNRIVKNIVKQNRSGLTLNDASNSNQVLFNVFSDNLKYGIAVDDFFILRERSSGNLFSGNNLYGNKINAKDASSAHYSSTLLYERFKKVYGLKNESLFKSVVKKIKKANNHWDNGKRGNRYDNFDEANEGFEDINRDGIGEKPYKIPGGESIDHFPLSNTKSKSKHTLLKTDKP